MTAIFVAISVTYMTFRILGSRGLFRISRSSNVDASRKLSSDYCVIGYD